MLKNPFASYYKLSSPTSGPGFRRWASAIGVKASKHHSPAVAYLIRRHRLSDVDSIPRTGRQGRLLKSDVLDFLQSRRVALTWTLPRYVSLKELETMLTTTQWVPDVPVVVNGTRVGVGSDIHSPVTVSLESIGYVKRPRTPSCANSLKEPTESLFLSLLGNQRKSIAPVKRSAAHDPRHLFEQLAGWPSPDDCRYTPILKIKMDVPSSIPKARLEQLTADIMKQLSAANLSPKGI